MPSWRIGDADSEVQQYDVGATDHVDSAFVVHVALCLAEPPIIVNKNSCKVAIAHMGPPLTDTEGGISIVGTALLDQNDLDPVERRQIKAFVDERLGERKSQAARLTRRQDREMQAAEYVIHPAFVEPEEDISYWRFSCAGFVMRAYAEASIDLLDVSNLPRIGMETLKAAYPCMARRLEKPDFRSHLGIADESADENGWPIVLAGYVINALDRSPEAIRKGPFSPKAGDEFFPPVHPEPTA